MHHKPTPNPNYKPKPAAPRKVRGGIKLASPAGAFAADSPQLWAAQRWMRLVEQAATGEALVAGLGYASAGQTRRLAIDPGRAHASIQGSVYTPYETALLVRPWSHDQTESVVAAMSDQAVHAAKLLAGELLPTIEDVLAPLDLRLFPAQAAEVEPRCTCKESRGQPVQVSMSLAAEGDGGVDAPPRAPGPIWCKHACCLAYLVAERLASDPFLMFTIRGLPKDELLERLRQRRAVAGSALGGALVYQPVVPGVSDAPAKPLEQCIDEFWEAGPELERLDAPIEPPPVSHPLLRRLGPSPMGGSGKFPLVGLLATCYDVISQATIDGERASEGEPAPHPADKADDRSDA